MHIDNTIQLAFQLYQSGNLQQAKHICSEILNEQPDNEEILYLLGIVHAQLEEYDLAIEHLKRLLHFNTNNAHAYLALGAIFQHRGAPDEAIDFYQRAIEIDADFAEAYADLGDAFNEKGQIDKAISVYQQALQLNPADFETYNNMASLLKQKMRVDEAIAHFQKAIQLNPNFTEAHANLYGMHLLTGNFKEAWKEIEWRNKLKECRHPGCYQRRWDGFDISRLTILIYNEQEDSGFGDTIQFIRYVPLVTQLGAKVIIACQKELLSLLQNVNGVDKAIIDGEHPPHFDVHCNFFSLPSIFNTTLDGIPAKIPYITADSALVQSWKNKIQDANSKFKVGLVWAADPKHSRFSNRSFSIESFSPLACLKDITFYSLQKGGAAQHTKNRPKDMNFVDYTEEIRDFSDTAALIANIDLIISADTAVAHLAGAVGKPVWTLLPYAPDGRWMLNRDDSPWYPTMRLFRQPSPGDWESVMSRVSIELQKKISHTRPQSKIASLRSQWQS
jgi:tetratricopeptide (TPR) repeat protein